MAVHGAAPSRMAPATYSVASPVDERGEDDLEEEPREANIVNGFTSQFTTRVTVSPFGWRRTPSTLRKSIWSIIGKIIAQMSTATGRFTCATESSPSRPGTAGTSCADGHAGNDAEGDPERE
jgi:hypothetical protein